MLAANQRRRELVVNTKDDYPVKGVTIARTVQENGDESHDHKKDGEHGVQRSL